MADISVVFATRHNRIAPSLTRAKGFIIPAKPAPILATDQEHYGSPINHSV
jgi:hypothetical protein